MAAYIVRSLRSSLIHVFIGWIRQMKLQRIIVDERT